MAINYFKKPVFLSALICIFFFYLFKGFFIKKENYSSLINTNDIVLIKGKIISSPGKTSSEKYYFCDFKLSETTSIKGIKSSATGIMKIYIPTQLVEAYFPGKLYSMAKYSKIKSIFESGGNYIFKGENYNKGFFVNTCEKSWWNKNIFGKIQRFRALTRLHFKRLMYKWGKSGGLLLALLSGAKEYTEDSLALGFKNAGLSHILALSGMHLSMFSAISIFIGKKIGRKKLSFIIRIISLIVFVWFAGFSASLTRAFICAMMIILGSIAGVKQPDMVLVLCFAFLLQSILCPDQIYNMGFILSYGALLGILLFSKLFNIFFIKFLPVYISGSLSASTGAQLFTAPICLKTFGTFSPIGIIATTVISPLISIFIYSGLFLILITLIFPVLVSPSGIFINLQYNVIRFLVVLFSRAPVWSIN